MAVLVGIALNISAFNVSDKQKSVFWTFIGFNRLVVKGEIKFHLRRFAQVPPEKDYLPLFSAVEADTA